jgi:hypothetical protein
MAPSKINTKMTSSLLPSSVVVRANTILASEVDDETMLLSMENSKYYGMADTANYIWEMIKEPMRLDQIVHHLTTVYNVDDKQCLKDVQTFLEELLRSNLITVK